MRGAFNAIGDGMDAVVLVPVEPSCERLELLGIFHLANPRLSPLPG